MTEHPYSSTETSTGLSPGDHVTTPEGPGQLIGIGFDGKGELLQVRLTTGEFLEFRAEEVQGV